MTPDKKSRYLLDAPADQDFHKLGEGSVQLSVPADWRNKSVFRDGHLQGVSFDSRGKGLNELSRVVWWRGNPSKVDSAKLPAVRYSLCDDNIGDSRVIIDSLIWVEGNTLVGRFDASRSDISDCVSIVLDAVNCQFSFTGPSDSRLVYMGTIQFQVTRGGEAASGTYGCAFSIPLERAAEVMTRE